MDTISIEARVHVLTALIARCREVALLINVDRGCGLCYNMRASRLRVPIGEYGRRYLRDFIEYNTKMWPNALESMCGSYPVEGEKCLYDSSPDKFYGPWASRRFELLKWIEDQAICERAALANQLD